MLYRVALSPKVPHAIPAESRNGSNVGNVGQKGLVPETKGL
jgi:hypothetical protein